MSAAVSQDLLAAADARATRVTAALSCVVTVRPDVATLLPWAPLVVDCWIGVCDEGDRRVVRLAGRLSEDQVPELLLACSTPPQVTLDLSDLVSTDDAGLDALDRIRVHGGTLTGAPRYIQLKLDSSARLRTRRSPGDVVDRS